MFKIPDATARNSYHDLTYQLRVSVSVYYKPKCVEYKLKTVLNNNKKGKPQIILITDIYFLS